MGCCSPNFHKQVQEQEKRVNEKGNEKLPPYIKWISIFLSILLLIIAIYLSI